MSIGKMQEFDPGSGNWSVYAERLEMYFLANAMKDEVKLPTLIAIMGDSAYELLSTLASPKKPSSLTYKEAVELLKNHLEPQPSTLAERYRFRQKRQMPGESIADYVADLKKLTRLCEFGVSLEENLRDQFVCGVYSEVIRQRLFAETNLTFKMAVNIAVTIEAAERHSNSVNLEQSKSPNGVDVETTLQQLSISSGGVCTACGISGHTANHCRYKDYECSLCNRVGHLRRMCTKKRESAEQAIMRERESGARSGARGGRASRGRGARGGYRRGGWRAAPAPPGRYNGAGSYWVQDEEFPGPEQGTEQSPRAQQPAEAASRGPADTAGATPTKFDSCEEDNDEEEPIYLMGLRGYKPI